jgi:hypothetical protein
MSSTKHVGDLGMNLYVCCITSSGARLIHIHQNSWAWISKFVQMDVLNYVGG